MCDGDHLYQAGMIEMCKDDRDVHSRMLVQIRQHAATSVVRQDAPHVKGITILAPCPINLLAQIVMNVPD